MNNREVSKLPQLPIICPSIKISRNFHYVCYRLYKYSLHLAQGIDHVVSA